MKTNKYDVIFAESKKPFGASVPRRWRRYGGNPGEHSMLDKSLIWRRILIFWLCTKKKGIFQNEKILNLRVGIDSKFKRLNLRIVLYVSTRPDFTKKGLFDKKLTEWN